MQILVFMLGIVFLVTRFSVRSSATTKMLQARSLLMAFLLTLGVFVQFFFFVRAPEVDYWKSGWGRTIRYLNEHFKAAGKPYQLPEP